jgi:hypothetical protein
VVPAPWFDPGMQLNPNHHGTLAMDPSEVTALQALGPVGFAIFISAILASFGLVALCIYAALLLGFTFI